MAEGTSELNIPQLTTQVYKRLERIYDPTHGGFGGAPKFPSPSQTIHFLTRLTALNLNNPKCKTEAEKAREMAVQTMTKIYNGGIRDVVGGGFARYSVDDHWHVPHCECLVYSCQLSASHDSSTVEKML